MATTGRHRGSRPPRRGAPLVGFLLVAVVLAASATAVAVALAGPVDRSTGIGPALEATGASRMPRNVTPVAPAPPVWTHPREIDGQRSTGGHGVPAATTPP